MAFETEETTELAIVEPTLRIRPTTPIISGVATTTSNSNQFSLWIFWTSSSAPT